MGTRRTRICSKWSHPKNNMPITKSPRGVVNHQANFGTIRVVGIVMRWRKTSLNPWPSSPPGPLCPSRPSTLTKTAVDNSSILLLITLPSRPPTCPSPSPVSSMFNQSEWQIIYITPREWGRGSFSLYATTLAFGNQPLPPCIPHLHSFLHLAFFVTQVIKTEGSPYIRVIRTDLYVHMYCRPSSLQDYSDRRYKKKKVRALRVTHTAYTDQYVFHHFHLLPLSNFLPLLFTSLS